MDKFSLFSNIFMNDFVQAWFLSRNLYFLLAQAVKTTLKIYSSTEKNKSMQKPQKTNLKKCVCLRWDIWFCFFQWLLLAWLYFKSLKNVGLSQDLKFCKFLALNTAKIQSLADHWMGFWSRRPPILSLTPNSLSHSLTKNDHNNLITIIETEFFHKIFCRFIWFCPCHIKARHLAV